MCNKAVENYPYSLNYVSECYRTQKMCDTNFFDAYPTTIKFVLEYFIDAFSYFILFLINIKLKKYVT